ncbi:TPA: hypothetical protein ACF2DD_001979 [Clostridium perfringens]
MKERVLTRHFRGSSFLDIAKEINDFLSTDCREYIDLSIAATESGYSTQCMAVLVYKSSSEFDF